MTNYEKYFGTPERVAKTYRKTGMCVPSIVYECTDDAAVSDRCPYYHRCVGLESQIEWLKSEADDDGDD